MLYLFLSSFDSISSGIKAGASDIDFASDHFPKLEASLDQLGYYHNHSQSASSDGSGNDGEDQDARLFAAIHELTELNDCLCNLVPTLDTIPVGTPSDDDEQLDAASVVSAECDNRVLDQDLPYFGSVRDKFPRASAKLVQNLAELNWSRHNLIRNTRKRWEDGPLQTEQVQQDRVQQPDRGESTIHIQPSNAADSGYESMQAGNAVLLDPHPPLFQKAMSVHSISSFGATTNPEKIGRTRYPPPPIKLGPDAKSFTCTICYRMLKGIDSKLLWR